MTLEHVSAPALMAPPESRRAMQRFLGRWLPLAGDLLDVGCGAGDFLEFAKGRGLTTTGIDRDPGLVAIALERGLDVFEGDVLDPPIGRDIRFDVVTMEHLVEHFAPAEAAELLAEYARRLRPGGRLVIVTPNYSDWAVASEIFWLDPTHVRPYPGGLLAMMVNDLGMRVIHVSTQRLVKLGIRSALSRPLGRVRFGRQFQRMNLVLVAELST